MTVFRQDPFALPLPLLPRHVPALANYCEFVFVGDDLPADDVVEMAAALECGGIHFMGMMCVRYSAGEESGFGRGAALCLLNFVMRYRLEGTAFHQFDRRVAPHSRFPR